MGNSLADSYKRVKEIGKGSYGVVYLAERKEDSQLVAIKTVKLQGIKPKIFEKTLNEVRLLASIRHPNILGFECSYYSEKDDSICIVTEYAEKGDLKDKIHKIKNTKCMFKEEQIWNVIFQLSRGLKFLHDNKIIHRDIKAANIFESADGFYKIGDLNLSKLLKEQFAVHTQVGTPYYLSPEVWKKQQYGTQCDIWSLGVLIYELAALQLPFKSQTCKELYKKIVNTKPAPLPLQYSSKLCKTIEEMLNLDPLKRPNADELIEICTQADKLFNWPTSLTCGEAEMNLIKTIWLPIDRTRWNNILPRLRSRKKSSDSEMKYKSNSIIADEQSENVGPNSSQRRCLEPAIKAIRHDKKREGSARAAKLPPLSEQPTPTHRLLKLPTLSQLRM